MGTEKKCPGMLQNFVRNSLPYPSKCYPLFFSGHHYQLTRRTLDDGFNNYSPLVVL